MKKGLWKLNKLKKCNKNEQWIKIIFKRSTISRKTKGFMKVMCKSSFSSDKNERKDKRLRNRNGPGAFCPIWLIRNVIRTLLWRIGLRGVFANHTLRPVFMPCAVCFTHCFTQNRSRGERINSVGGNCRRLPVFTKRKRWFPKQSALWKGSTQDSNS